MNDDYVIDASALLLALIDRSRSADALRTRLPGMRLHAPHLIDAEVGNVLRRHERAKLIGTGEAVAALGSARALIGRRYPHTGPIGDGAWSLRHNLTFYDALYVALASQLGMPLLTSDERLAHAAGLPCTVELV